MNFNIIEDTGSKSDDKKWAGFGRVFWMRARQVFLEKYSKWKPLELREFSFKKDLEFCLKKYKTPRYWRELKARFLNELTMY